MDKEKHIDPHANAVRVLRAADARGRGWLRWNVGKTTLAIFRSASGRFWWLGGQVLHRDTARLILRGLLAPQHVTHDEAMRDVGRAQSDAKWREKLRGLVAWLREQHEQRDVFASTVEALLLGAAERGAYASVLAKLREMGVEP